MGIKLVVEVLDHAPAELTSGERLVLIVIAEWANDNTRTARQSTNWTVDTIARRAGLSRSGLKAAFRGLARKGCEVRVEVGVDWRGHPVYAFEGTAMTFVVPKLAERGHPDDSSEGSPQHPRGVTVASERGHHSDPLPLNSPHLSPHVTDQNSPASSRFAPSGAGSRIPSPRADESDTGSVVVVEERVEERGRATSAKEFNDARARDRELFRSLVGERLSTDGSKFSPAGIFTADQFYDAFRKWKRKKRIDWPGRMLEKIDADNRGQGVEDWLLHLGLEVE